MPEADYLKREQGIMLAYRWGIISLDRYIKLMAELEHERA